MSALEGPVLIAFDGSAAARQAVADAAKLLRPSKALVITVWEEGLAYATAMMPPDGMMFSPMVEPSVARDVDQGLHQHAERVALDGAQLARSLGVDAQPLAVPDDGDVARTILNAAREHDAAAIVVGSRGLSGLRARVEGSTSKGLLKLAPCPVLVVHEAEHEDD